MSLSGTDRVINALASTGAGIWEWDSDRPDELNVQWSDGVTVHDMRGDVGDEEWHLLMSRLQQTLLDRQAFHAPVKLDNGDDGWRELQLLGGCSRKAGASGCVTGLCWLGGDELRGDAQAQWAPLAKLSHELRSPLAAVAQQVHELAGRVHDTGVNETLDSVHQSVVYMLRIIEDMLVAFRAGEPVLSRQPECVSTERLIGQIVPVVAECAQRKGLHLQVREAAGFPTRFLAEPVALRRILQNLLDNAVKYTACGEITLSLAVAEDTRGALLRFDVEDSGPGMSAEEIARVFEPFAQGRAGQYRSTGLGIGLALSQQLAVGLDGELRVHSEPGSGSRFSLTIPARVPAEPGVEHEPAGVDADIAVVKPGTRVLLVDDHPLLSRLTGRALRKLGCEVEFAMSARDAIAIVEQRGFDLVILDLDLPDMSGCDLCSRLKDRERLPACRFVAYSGSDEPVDRRAAQRAGFDAFFVKPASAEDLLGI